MYAKPLQTLSDLDRNLENAEIDLSLSGKLYFQMKSKVFLQNVLGAAGAGGVRRRSQKITKILQETSISHRQVRGRCRAANSNCVKNMRYLSKSY